MSKTEIVRKRKPPARRSEIVLAAIDERVLILDGYSSEFSAIQPHTARLVELLAELRRSISRNADSGEGE